MFQPNLKVICVCIGIDPTLLKFIRESLFLEQILIKPVKF